jgi:hypothetical protein
MPCMPYTKCLTAFLPLLAALPFVAHAQERPEGWGNLPDLYVQGEVAPSGSDQKQISSGIIPSRKSSSNHPSPPLSAPNFIIYGSGGGANVSDSTAIDTFEPYRGITVIQGTRP